MENSMDRRAWPATSQGVANRRDWASHVCVTCMHARARARAHTHTHTHPPTWAWFVIYFSILLFSDMILPSRTRRNVPVPSLLPPSSKSTLMILKHLSLAIWHGLHLCPYRISEGPWRRKGFSSRFWHAFIFLLLLRWAGGQETQGNSPLEKFQKSSTGPPLLSEVSSTEFASVFLVTVFYHGLPREFNTIPLPWEASWWMSLASQQTVLLFRIKIDLIY